MAEPRVSRTVAGWRIETERFVVWDPDFRSAVNDGRDLGAMVRYAPQSRVAGEPELAETARRLALHETLPSRPLPEMSGS